MLDEIRKSINAILYERVTSPFYGTLIISWLAWNWKIVYVTFFVSADKVDCSGYLTANCSKIDYILEHCTNPWNLIYWPLISLVGLLVIMPLFTNGAYWLDLLFKSWKIRKKAEFDEQTPLLPKQANALRRKIKDMDEMFERLSEEKDAEIQSLNSIKGELNNKKTSLGQSLEQKNSELNRIEKKLETQKSGQEIALQENEELNEKINELQQDLFERTKDVEFLNKEYIPKYEYEFLSKAYLGKINKGIFQSISLLSNTGSEHFSNIEHAAELVELGFIEHIKDNKNYPKKTNQYRIIESGKKFLNWGNKNQQYIKE